MKHIVKGNPPQSLLDWISRIEADKRSRATYDELSKPRNRNIKTDLKASLLDEQYGLCCYCGLALDDDITHIEHFMPQNKYKKKQLDYTNLHASCMGKEAFENTASEHDFCGHSKGNWFDPLLTISPLDPNCEIYFTYSFDGSINPTDLHPGSSEMIEQLGLDKYLPTELRRQAIDAVLENVDLTDKNNIRYWINFLRTPNSQNKLPSFSYIISGLLETYL